MQSDTIQMIPLCELGLSENNARRLAAGCVADEELKASIEARGILSNLVVRKLSRPKKGGVKYTVVAGGRRRRCLDSLADDKKIDRGTYLVPCRVIGAAARAKDEGTANGQDLELSLHENMMRAEMHAVDKFEAFKHLIDQNVPPEAIARRFGCTTRTVDGYLRLADLHPQILEAARTTDIDIEVLKAFACTPDQSRQIEVWNEIDGMYGTPEAGWIRSEMLRDRMSAAHGRVRFVGLETYQEAGGKVERDLFTESDEDAHVTDVDLVNRLVLAKLRTARDQIKDSWGWADTALEVRYEDLHKYGRIRGIPGELTDEEQALDARLGERIAAAEARIEEINNAGRDDEPDGENDQDEDLQKLYQRSGQMRQERRRLQERREQRATFDPDQQKHAGVILTIDADGRLERHAGLVREADAKNMPERKREQCPDGAAAGAGAAEGVETGGQPGPADMEPTYRPPLRPVTREDRERDAKSQAGLNNALYEDLKIVRNTLTKIELAKSYAAAFDLATYQLAESLLTSMGKSRGALSLSATATPTRVYLNADDRAAEMFGPSDAALEAMRTSLDLGWMGIEDRIERFTAFCQLKPADKRAIFAACIARTLNSQLSLEPAADERPEIECTIARLGVRFAKGFRPTAHTFWSRVTKGDALAAARATLGDAWAEAHAKDKKDELAEHLGKAFAGKDEPVDLDTDQKTAARAWVPPGFAPFSRAGVDPHKFIKDAAGTNGMPPADFGGGVAAAEVEEDTTTAVAPAPTGGEPAGEPDTFDRTPATEAPAFLND